MGMTPEEKKQESIREQKQINLEDDIIKSSLEKVGIKVYSIDNLIHTSESYPEAIDTLIDLLASGKVKHRGLQEGIIRALTVKEAKGKANRVLLDLYNITSKNEQLFLWAIGNAFSVIVQPEDLEEIYKIVLNKENGMSRSMFVRGLGKIKSKKSEEVLMKLLDDKQEVALPAIYSLGMLKSVIAEEKISSFLNAKETIVKNEAKKALIRIRKGKPS